MAGPYRQPGVQQSPAEETPGDLLRCSVSGRKGLDGAPGRDGNDGSGGGQNGSCGGDAGSPQPGEPGGRIDLRLAAGGGDGVDVEGQLTSLSRAPRPIRQVLQIGESGDIVLLARGGEGGSGGRGGQGGDGARGSSGSNASRYSSGGDGGRGGDGGDGGNGTHGANGGVGGAVQVSVAEHDTHLLMLVRASVAGGGGGAPGTNGPGGAGGSGGSGGSSHSWTESESYTDSQGQRQSRTTYHRNSGGSSGPSGRNGSPGRAELAGGAAGRAGALTIRVVRAGNAEDLYTARYDLSLKRLVHESENADGIHEPGERIVVRDIAIENTGGMPTPSQRPTVLELLENEWVTPETKSLEVPRSLAAGESLQLPGPLTFVVRSVQVAAPGEAFLADGTIAIDAHIPAVKRSFHRFGAGCPEHVTRFAVRFPLQLSPVSCLFSMAPGESARLEFTIRNVSKKSFGEQSEVGRSIGWTLRLVSSQVGASQVAFTEPGAHGDSLDSGIHGAITQLPAGQEVTVVGTLQLAADARAYDAIRLRAALELGGVQSPSILVPIHLRDFVVRVAERFKPDPTASVLLVVHNRTTREELEGWRTVADELGLTLAVWDVALEGHLDVEAPIEGGALARQFAGKPIVVLNDPFDTGRGEQHAHALLDSDAVLRHCADGGSAVVVGSRKFRLDWSLMPRARSGSAEPTAGELDEDAAALAAKALTPLSPPCILALEKTTFFGLPKEADLERAARSLTHEADRSAPGIRHVATYTFDGQLKTPGFPKRWSLGTVALERTLDANARGVVALAATEEALRDPARVTAAIAPLALALGLPSAARQRALRTALATSTNDAVRPFAETDAPRPADWLRRAIYADIGREVITARVHPGLAKRPESGPDPAFPELTKLVLLAQTDGGFVDPESPIGTVLIEGMAVGRAVAWSLVPWWILLPPVFLLFAFSRALTLHRRARAAADAVFDAAFPRAGDGADPRRVLARKLLKRAARHVSQAGKPKRLFGVGRSSEAIVEWLEAPLTDAGFRAADERGSLVVSEAERREFDDARGKQSRRRAKVVASIANERGARLVIGAVADPSGGYSAAAVAADNAEKSTPASEPSVAAPANGLAAVKA